MVVAVLWMMAVQMTMMRGNGRGRAGDIVGFRFCVVVLSVLCRSGYSPNCRGNGMSSQRNLMHLMLESKTQTYTPTVPNVAA